MLLKKFETKSPFDVLFNDTLFNDTLFNDYIPKNNYIPFDVIEDEDSYKINLMLAGYNKDDFKLEVEDGKLIISGERVERENTKYNFKNSYYGKFTKTFTLPKNVLINKIDAQYVDGILDVNVPKDKKLISSKTIVVR